jgi:succinate dehydrogenase flavin-adding protein (antitoxin of CptAB toxin-antitoxin module)
MSNSAEKFLDDVINEPFSFGSMIENIRKTNYEYLTFKGFASWLGISEKDLELIENNSKNLSEKEVKNFAKLLEDSEKFFLKTWQETQK